MTQYKNIFEKLAYEEFEDIIKAKDKKIEEKNKKIEEKDKTIEEKDEKIEKLEEYKDKNNSKLKQLNKLENLTPEAKKIINSMLLL